MHAVIAWFATFMVTIGSFAVAPLAAQAVPLSVAQENALPGDASWYVLDRLAPPEELSVLADELSVLPGQSVGVRIDNRTATQQRVLAPRIGWYQGLGGRLVHASEWAEPTTQPAATWRVTDSAGRTINSPDASNWRESMRLDTSGWPEGQYVITVQTRGGAVSQATLMVRSASFAGRTVITTAPQTVAAYNRWGGASAYYGKDASGAWKSALRSRVISFDRPLDAVGLEHFEMMERPLISQAERLGINLAYTTSVDLSTTGAPGATTVVTLGHDEYWDNAQAARLTALRDAGTNLLFLGANTYWWRIRYTPDRRGFEVWKSASEDPVKTSGQQTVNFPRAEAVKLLGSQYTVSGFESLADTVPLTVVDPGNFMFAGTGAVAGTQVPGLTRTEVDTAVQSDTTAPPTLSVAAHTTFAVNGLQRAASVVYCQDPSGAGVVNLGTMGLAVAVGDRLQRLPMPQASRQFAVQMLRNLLVEGSRGRLGVLHPPLQNADVFLGRMPTPSLVTEAEVSMASGGSGVPGDYTQDRRADVLGVAPDARMVQYRTAVGPQLVTGVVMGTNWSMVQLLGKVNDLNRDGLSEVVGRGPDGHLYLWRTQSSSFFAQAQRIGTNWQSVRQIVAVADCTGDGRPELLAINSSGDLTRYGFSATGKLQPGVRIGSGFGNVVKLLGVSTMVGSAGNDLMAVRTDGTLWVHELTAPGGLGTSRQVGHGWGAMRMITTPGDMDGDGRIDLVVVRGDGNLYFYRNQGSWWAPARKVGSNWASVRSIV